MQPSLLNILLFAPCLQHTPSLSAWSVVHSLIFAPSLKYTLPFWAWFDHPTLRQNCPMLHLHALSSSDDKIRTSFTATFLVLDLCSMLIIIAYSLARFVHSLAEQIFAYFLQPAPCLTHTPVCLDLGIRIQGEHSFLCFRASSFGTCLTPSYSKKISCAYSLKLKFSLWVLLVCRHRD